MSEADFLREYRALRVAYRKRLPRKVAELAAVLRHAAAAADAASLQSARRLAHTLRGTAGSYGFTHTATELELIESRIGRLLESDRGEGAALWREIERGFERIRGSVAASEVDPEQRRTGAR